MVYKIKGKKLKEKKFYSVNERERKEEKLMNYILESWSEGVSPNIYKIQKEIKQMSEKDLDAELEMFEEE